MITNIIHNDSLITIILSGELDMSKINDIKTIIMTEVFPKNTNIELDMMDVLYIDSTMLGFFIHLYTLQKNRNRELRIKKVSKAVYKIMTLSSVDEIFKL